MHGDVHEPGESVTKEHLWDAWDVWRQKLTVADDSQGTPVSFSDQNVAIASECEPPGVRESARDRHDPYAVLSRIERDRLVWRGDGRDDARALRGRKYSDARDHEDEDDEETAYRPR